jgi:hypothetical protein
VGVVVVVVVVVVCVVLVWAESRREDMPAARYSKGDIISVQIGVRDVNTDASPHAPGWSRYMRYHISFGPYQPVVTTTTTTRRTYRSCVRVSRE